MNSISALGNFTLALSDDFLFATSIAEFAFVNPDHLSPPYSPDDQATTVLELLAEVRNKTTLFLLPHCLTSVSNSQTFVLDNRGMLDCLVVQNVWHVKGVIRKQNLLRRKCM
jgi:hypothetical protein